MTDSTERRKIEIKGTVQEILENLEDQLKDFLVHRCIKRKQVEHMTKVLSSCDGESILLQADYSENAGLISQDEVQSHTWINDITSESYIS